MKTIDNNTIAAEKINASMSKIEDTSKNNEYSETEIKDLTKENLMLKIALCKMIRQFCFCRTLNGVEHFDDLCESAGEWAFKALGFKEDLVMVDKIYEVEERAGEELLKINKSMR